MLPCNNPHSTWHYHYVSCEPVFNWIILCNYEGCIKGFDAGMSGNMKGEKLVDELTVDWWGFDSDAFDAVCFGSGLLWLLCDPSLCLQLDSDADDAPV
jgi:hypothetical protein